MHSVNVIFKIVKQLFLDWKFRHQIYSVEIQRHLMANCIEVN
jgi:hypothetical protein